MQDLQESPIAPQGIEPVNLMANTEMADKPEVSSISIDKAVFEQFKGYVSDGNAYRVAETLIRQFVQDADLRTKVLSSYPIEGSKQRFSRAIATELYIPYRQLALELLDKTQGSTIASVTNVLFWLFCNDMELRKTVGQSYLATVIVMDSHAADEA